MIAVLALVAGVAAGLLPRTDGAARAAALSARSRSWPRSTRSSAASGPSLDGVFDDKQFVVSFVSNVLVAAFIVFLGDKLGVGGQLSTGVVVVLGVRIFGNVAAIRRHLFKA